MLYPDFSQEFTNGNSLLVHMDTGKEEFLRRQEEFNKMAEEAKASITYENVSEVDDSSVGNTIVIASLATVIIFVVAITNIVHLMLYWIMERKKAIGIIKALGADKKYIAKNILCEILVMAMIGCFLALLIQYITICILKTTNNQGLVPLQISYMNLVCAMVVSIFFGSIASFVPIKKALDFEPIKTINSI